jgi:hypothetical protein
MTPALWLLGPNNVGGESLAYREYYARYFEDKGALPAVVVQMYQVPASRVVDVVYSENSDAVLKKLAMHQNYQAHTDRAKYRIWVRRDASPIGLAHAAHD